MAKQLQKLTASFSPLRKKAEDACSELKSISVNRAHANQMVSEAAAELTRRVQALRNGGAQGTKLDDFRDDAEVRDIVATVEDFKRKQGAWFERAAALRGAADAAADDIEALRAKVDREVADRKKKRDRAVLPVGSASLPELEKLSAEMERVVTDTRQEAAFSRNWTHQPARMDRQLEDAVAETKAGPQAERDRKAMDKHALGLRLLKASVQDVTRERGAVKTACVAVLRAVKAGDADAARTALTAARRSMDSITETAERIDRAMEGKGEFDLQAMQQSKDGRTVLAAVAKIRDLAGEARSEFDPVAKAAAKLVS